MVALAVKRFKVCTHQISVSLCKTIKIPVSLFSIFFNSYWTLYLNMRFNFWYTYYTQKLWKEKWVFSINNFHSSLGIHLLHQKLFLRLLSSSILSFKVLKIFLWSLRAEARAFLDALAFFWGSISYIMKNGVI